MEKIKEVAEKLEGIQLDDFPPYAKILISSFLELVEAVKRAISEVGGHK